MKFKVFVFVLILALLTGCAAPAAAPAQEAPAGENVIKVATLDELIAAVAPGVTVELAEGTHTLTPPAAGGDVSEYCRWVDVYDGLALEIHDVTDLTIRGAGAGKTVVSAVPRYANVLTFTNCEGVTVSDLTAGHTVEPGACSGGVLAFDSCSRALVDGCGLYGCGTIGVSAQFCRDLTVNGCSIYECSYNAASIYDCRNTLVRDCDVYQIGCGSEDWPAPCMFSLFESYGGEGLTVLGCRIHDSAAQSLLSATQTRDVRFLSNDVRSNRFDGPVFALERYNAAVDGCSLNDNSFSLWYGAIRPVNAAGEALDGAALEAMELREMDPDQVHSPAAAPAETEVTPDGEIRVSTVDELLAAIGPDRTVILAPGTYDLSAAANYGGLSGTYYYWLDTYDGYELVIDGVRNLTIRAEAPDAGDTLISAESRYANVISFRNSEKFSLVGFTAGHTPDRGECSGGVIDLQNCLDVYLGGCRLYGCGVIGVRAWQCSSLHVDSCEIFDCSWHAVSVSDSSILLFDNCDIHDIPSPAVIISGCADLFWNSEPMGDGSYDVNAEGMLDLWPPYEEEWNGESSSLAATPFKVDSPELAFALEVQRVFARADWEALAGLVSYPLRIRTPEGTFVFQDAQSLTSERMDRMLTGEFRQAVAQAGLYEYRHTGLGSVFADGAVAFECFVTAQGEELRITAISTRFDLDR